MTAEQSELPVAAFWRFESVGERRIVRDVLYRRFPRLTSLLADCLAASATYDIAHPGNPDGDNDVIVETLVLLADVNGNLSRLPTGRLHDILGEGMARSLGRPAAPRTVHEVARMVDEASATIDWDALTWVEATDFDGSIMPEDIRPLSAPFWTLRTSEERTTVNAVLARRFPRAAEIVSVCLEQADAQDIVYPDQTPEYTEVVREVLTLLSDVYADLGRVSPVRLESVLLEALARCFGEPPEEGRVSHAVNLIAEHATLRGR